MAFASTASLNREPDRDRAGALTVEPPARSNARRGGLLSQARARVDELHAGCAGGRDQCPGPDERKSALLIGRHWPARGSNGPASHPARPPSVRPSVRPSMHMAQPHPRPPQGHVSQTIRAIGVEGGGVHGGHLHGLDAELSSGSGNGHGHAPGGTLSSMMEGQVPSAYDRHAVLVYHDEALRWAELAAFAKRGLEGGELVLCTAASEDCAFEERLAARGVDVAGATRAGQLLRVPLVELFSAGGMTGYVTRALERGYPGVRVCGNAASSTAQLGSEGMRAAEREMDRLCDTLPVAAMCQYDAGAGTPQQVRELVGAHPQVVRTDTLLLTRRGEQVHLSGEIDVSSAQVLKAALERAADDTDGRSMLVDLTKLAFIDIAGYDALIRGTERLRSDGGTLVLRGATGAVLRVLDLVDIRKRGDVLFI